MFLFVSFIPFKSPPLLSLSTFIQGVSKLASVVGKDPVEKKFAVSEEDKHFNFSACI
jgi:hypothetical protein